MAHALQLKETRRLVLLAAGLLLGLSVAGATAGLSWQTGAIGLSIGLAALVGLAQTCSA